MQARPALPFRTTERLTYEAEFTRALLRGINIAEFDFRLEERAPTASASASIEHARPELVIHSEGISKGFFNKLFGLNFRFQIESTVAPDSFTLRSTRIHDEQGERLRQSEAVFNHGARRVTWTERDPKAETKEPRIVITDFGAGAGTPQDLASVFYYLRTLPLKVGASFELMISDSGRIYRVPVRVVKRASVDTPIGKRHALELSIDLFGVDRPAEGKGQMSVWLTDDDRRLPVRARIRHDLGTLTIKLKRYHAG